MMIFGAPWWLLATAAGSVPLIIHLLNRRRFKRMAWAAMEFLLAAMQKNRKRMRLENLLILLLRMLVLILLAIALAQPFLGRNNPLRLGGGARVCRIFILDDSYSMRYESGATTPFDMGRRLIGGVLDTASRGDWTLLICTSSNLSEIGEPGTNLETMRSELERAEPSDVDADVPEALQRAIEAAAKGSYPRTEIYVLSDFQRRSWFDDKKLTSEKLPEMLRDRPESLAVFFVDTGGDRDPVNAAFTELDLTVGETEVPQRLVAAGMPVTVSGMLSNFSSTPLEGLTVRLLVDGRIEGRKTVSVDAGGDFELQFPIVFEQTGFHTVQLECDHDRLRIDDVRSLSVDVRQEVGVLCVNGEPSGDLVDNETYFLERSLSPQQFEFARDLSVFTTRTVSDVEFINASLADVKLVVLANVFQVPSQKVKVLERFVEAGGALLIFVGDRVEPGAYDAGLWADGKGLLPMKLNRAKVTAKTEKDAVRFDLRGADHPVLRLFARQGIDLGMSRVWGCFSLIDDEPRSDVRVLCRFTDAEGTPAMVEKSFGSGRVALINTSADPEWSSFAAGPFFPLFVQEMCRYLVPGSLEEANLNVGEPLRQVLFPGQFGQRVLVTDSQGNLTETMPEPVGETFLFKFADTSRAGIYTVDFDGTLGRAVYAVNVDARESDLERTSTEELKTVLPDARVQYVEDASRLVDIVEQEATSRPIWRPLVYVVLVIMLIESILSQRFGNRSGVRTRYGN